MVVCAGGRASVKLLVIQFWTTDLGPIEASLRVAGIVATIRRVDFEAALHAALAHERFDAAILDPNVQDLSRHKVQACFKLNGRDIPLVVIDEVADVGAELRRLLAALRN